MAEYAKRLHHHAENSSDYAIHYQTLACLCDVLTHKLLLASNTRTQYLANDRDGLRALAENDYTLCISLLDTFYKVYRKQWYTINKTYGFEIHDARLGGLKRRLESCRERLLAYVNGEIEKIEELEETLLPLKDTFITSWAEMFSANVM
jgi:hypothetical protein